MRKAAPMVALLAAACYVGPPRYYQPHPAPAPPAARPAPAAPSSKRMLTESEAVSVALGYARANGAEVSKLKHAHLDGAGRWHVELRAERGKDRAKVMVDAWTGQVVKASLKDDD
ncbi:MAG TPA: hypothetical protein VFF02_07355 [Anaeromyxobacteraceae bacterium]|nr:hypothetical protein [Anaeromyxobacteraceae bacterium]